MTNLAPTPTIHWSSCRSHNQGEFHRPVARSRTRTTPTRTPTWLVKTVPGAVGAVLAAAAAVGSATPSGPLRCCTATCLAAAQTTTARTWSPPTSACIVEHILSTIVEDTCYRAYCSSRRNIQWHTALTNCDMNRRSARPIRALGARKMPQNSTKLEIRSTATWRMMS